MKDALEKFSQLSERKQGALFRSLELKRFLSIKSCFLYLKMKYLSSYELLATLPFKGRKYSASRLSSAYAVFVDLPVMPVLPHWLAVTSGVFGVLFAGSEGKGSVAMGVSRPRAKNQAA